MILNIRRVLFMPTFSNVRKHPAVSSMNGMWIFNHLTFQREDCRKINELPVIGKTVWGSDMKSLLKYFVTRL